MKDLELQLALPLQVLNEAIIHKLEFERGKNASKKCETVYEGGDREKDLFQKYLNDVIVGKIDSSIRNCTSLMDSNI